MKQQNKPSRDEDDDFSMRIVETERVAGVQHGHEVVIQHTSRGDVHGRYYRVPGPTRACIFVGGVGGGFDSPIGGRLYPQLCGRLQQAGIASVRVQFRHPTSVEESALDVLSFVSFLEDEVIHSMGIVGHSLGGAVAIQAASHAQSIITCVTLASQSFGAEEAAELGDRCSLLVAHGSADQVLPPECSRHIHGIARGHKRLIIGKGVGHELLEWENELPHIVYDWLVEQLGRQTDDA